MSPPEAKLVSGALVCFQKDGGCNRRGSRAGSKTSLLGYQEGIGHTSKTWWISKRERKPEQRAFDLGVLSKAIANNN